MTKQTIDRLAPGTQDGDDLYTTAGKINDNFSELYVALGDGTSIDPAFAGLKGTAPGFIVSQGAAAYITREMASATLTILNGNGLSGNIAVELPTTGVVAATYADNGFTVDAYGRLTAVTTPTGTPTAVAAAAAAAVSEGNAATSEANAATSATAASASATAAAADAVSTAADLVQTDLDATATAANAVLTAADLVQTDLDVTATAASASAASTSASGAATSASGAATSATNAATSATNAGTSETNAAASATSAAADLAEFQGIYYGSLGTAPTVSVVSGDIYFDTGSSQLLVYNGSTWQAGVTSTSGLQPIDAALTSISNLTTVADKMPYTTASDTYAVTDLTAAGRALIDDASATAQRTTLGLGSMATQASSSVSVTGGAISGITDLAVADGGTGQGSYTNGQLLVGNTTGNTLDKATITAGSGISVTNGAGAITIASTSSGISMGKAIAAAIVFG